MTPVAPSADAGAAAGAAEGAAAGAGGGAGWAGGGGRFAGDSGAWASTGDAPSLGGLSVPPNWFWAAAPPAPQLLFPAGAPLASRRGADLSAAGLGFPFAFGGLPKAAAIGAAAGAGGAAASKYASRLKVVARSPEAGYAAESAAPSTNAISGAHGRYPTNGNGHAPPGYRPAIVYLPTNGHDPATI